MKYIIIIFILFFSCKEKETHTVISKIKTQNKVLFYDLIFDELKSIDIDKFYVTYEINSSFNITDEIKVALEKNNIITPNEKNKLSDEFINTNFSTQLSSRIENILKISKNKSQKKTELNYDFSRPYQINENKVLILNLVRYREQLSKDVKGGSERVIVFIKNNDDWNISKIINLFEM
tara:strand:+ start:2195 stop:2728 length:534 start_codon:yes stop_codon:yes gene_type:complete